MPISDSVAAQQYPKPDHSGKLQTSKPIMANESDALDALEKEAKEYDKVSKLYSIRGIDRKLTSGQYRDAEIGPYPQIIQIRCVSHIGPSMCTLTDHGI